LIANISIAKDDARTTSVSGNTSTYSVTVSNPGPSAANGTQVSDVPPASLIGCSVTNCAAVGGAVCPAASSWPSLLTVAGVAIPTLPANGGLTFSLSCTVSATGQ
jgi:uncharacterized repeat protein (TIGR01451 family)